MERTNKMVNSEKSLKDIWKRLKKKKTKIFVLKISG